MYHPGPKLHTWLGAGLALALPCLAVASPPSDAAPDARATVPDARDLGVSESMLNSCASQDPTAAESLRQKIQALLGEASPQQLAEVRNSNDYRNAFESVSKFVAKIDPHNLQRFCSESATGK